MSSVPKLPVTAEKVYLQYNEISNIQSNAFHGLSNLEFLYFDHNEISSIEPFAFDGLANLKYLELRNNKLSFLGDNSLAAMPQLKQIFLVTNNIKVIADNAFNGTESLEYVNIQANELTCVPSLGHQPNLNELDLESNHIIDVTFPVSYRTGSKKISIVLGENSIKELTNATFENLSNNSLTKLYLNRNEIGSIESGSFSCLSSITSLKLGSNPLTSKTLKTAVAGLAGKDIRSLDLSAINLNGVLMGDTFALLTNTTLHSLIMKSNQIKQLRGGTFSKLNSLSMLDLSKNNINIISDNAFSGLYQLSTLKLSDNELRTVPTGLPTSLNFLYLERNKIASIESNSFVNQVNLWTLRLMSNNIHQVKNDAFNGLVNLKKLKLNDNKINPLPGSVFSSLTRLQHLDLSRNNLYTIQRSKRRFASLVALEYFNIADNQCSFIQKDAFRAMLSLKYLHLERNNLGNIFSNDVNGELLREAKKLEELHIMNNNIESLQVPTLQNQFSLRILNASHNKLATLGSTLFKSTQELSKLDLSYNLISTVGKDNLTDLGNLKYLDLTGSPFSCDCNLRWFRDWINKTTTTLINVGGYTCNSPNDWKGIRVLEFDGSKINCFFLTTSAIVGIAVGTLLLSLLLVWLIYKNRWRLRLCWYKLSKRGRRFLKRSRSPHNGTNYGTIPDHTYDAYVSCSMSDRDWALQHLLPGIDRGQLNKDHKFGGEFRLYYEDRDAEPGTELRLQPTKSCVKVLARISSMTFFLP